MFAGVRAAHADRWIRGWWLDSRWAGMEGGGFGAGVLSTEFRRGRRERGEGMNVRYEYMRDGSGDVDVDRFGFYRRSRSSAKDSLFLPEAIFPSCPLICFLRAPRSILT